jgi:chromosome segregation ATPase
MVNPGYGGGLDTPRTNIGDATYLSRQPDFDISQEASFQSPSKDANLLAQLRNGGRPTLRTPRGNTRAPFGDRKNLPAGLGGAEFTPLLKSATRNSTRRYGPGKENGVAATPAFLAKIDEDMTPMAAGESSIYNGSRNTSSYDATALPEVDASSVASTPMVMRKRGGDGKGPLEDGNQLSLREQENVIDRIEKENFGLKLKIHFLEEALRKAGPGFSEAALRENTELKVDKVTMQRELLRYKKHLNSAEKDLESHRQQILQVQEQARKKGASEALRTEMEELRRLLEGKDEEIGGLQRQLEREKDGNGDVERLKDDVADLEAELREKDRAIDQHDDELDELRQKLEQAEEEARDSRRQMEELEQKARKSGELEEEADVLRLRLEQAEDEAKDHQRRMIELEQKAQSSDELEDAKDTIHDLEATVRRLEQQVDDLKDKLEDAISDKNRAEGDLEELQEEMANKSMVTKGLSRQVEEKITRLQNDLEKSRQDYAALEREHESSRRDNEDLKSKMREGREGYQALRKELELTQKQSAELGSKTKDLRNLQMELGHSERKVEELQSTLKDLRQERDSSERIRQSLASKLEEAVADYGSVADEKNLLQTRHDALTAESASLQREVSRLKNTVQQLEESLEQERQHALEIERDVRSQYKEQIDRLNDEVSDLQAEVRERENLYDNDSEKWETERHTLESERNRAEERAAGLQKTIDKLREAEGSLSNKENKMQEALQMENERHKKEEAILSRQIDELQQNLEARQGMLEDLRNELSTVRDELRQTQLDYRTQTEKVAALEDEVEILQATIDEESEKANSEIEQAKRQSEILEEELRSLRRTMSSAEASRDTAKNATENLARLKFQLADANDNLAKVTRERQALQDQVATINVELHSLRSSLAETKAERDELEEALKQSKSHDGDTFRLDQERIDLRATRTRLENEIRRLKDDNQLLTEQRRTLEKSLEDEIDKAAAEEDRLNREILELQKRSRPVVDSQELSSARRTIRELERRIEEYETRLAELQAPPPQYTGDGSSELSLVRRDLNTARQKELELLQREAAQKDTVRSLKRQITDLERRAHEAEMARLIVSPRSSAGGSAQKTEVAELRSQLTVAHQTANELKKSLREADRNASAVQRDLEARLEEAEEQKRALEQALEDAQIAAEEADAAHEKMLAKVKHKLEKYKREVTALREQQHDNHTGGSEMDDDERRDLHAMLRDSQLAADKLDREVRELHEALEEHVASEASLKRKLEKARSDKAAYRASAEKLQRDVKALEAAKEAAEAAAKEAVNAKALVHVTRSYDNTGDITIDTDAIIRAAEAAEKKHQLELRGMCMQLEVLKARWERENRLRTDAAYAKRYLLLQIEVRDAWYVFLSIISYFMTMNLKLTFLVQQQQSRPRQAEGNLGPTKEAPSRAGELHTQPESHHQPERRPRHGPSKGEQQHQAGQQQPPSKAAQARPDGRPLRGPHADGRPRVAEDGAHAPPAGRGRGRDDAQGEDEEDAGRVEGADGA